LGIIRRWTLGKALVSFLMATVLVLSLASCGDRAASLQAPGANRGGKTQMVGEISEVAPPEVIQQLRPALEANQPQVTILSPQQDEVLQDTKVAVRFQVQDLPVFKNLELEMGPHLHVILDNQPYIAVYDKDKPLVFEDLPPGTHTLRVFASRPWHESFKNEGAYAQTTFHIFTKTTDNNPNPTQPLLTYSRPKGSYGAEPIMLDFYLTNAPLHLVAQENPKDDIADWRIRVTVNNQSFVLDKWQPIYLKGFKSGKNWVQLEFIDELGNPLKNVFNDTVRLITYEPNGKDTLSKMVRGELSTADVRGIVDPNYKSQKPAATPIPTPTSTASPEPLPTPTSKVEPTPADEAKVPEVELKEPDESVPAELKQTEKGKSGGFLSRFRRPSVNPSPPDTLPEVVETPTPEAVAPESPAPTPTPTPTVEETPTPEAVAPKSPAPTPTPTPTVEETPTPEAPPAPPQQTEKGKSGGFLSRFRRSPAFPSLAPTLPEIVPTPAPEPVAPESPIAPLEKTPTTMPLQRTPTSEQAGEVLENSNQELSAPKSTSSPRFRIIQTTAESQIPSRFIQKSASATLTPKSVDTSEKPADSDKLLSVESEAGITP
jgi:hypothetical protein